MKVVPLFPQSADETPSQGAAGRVISVLDVGSSKTSCMIGEVRGPSRRSGGAPTVRITGVGVQASRGVRGGVVVDVEAAERSVRLAVDAAERMSGARIGEVCVNISGGRPRCETIVAEIATDGASPLTARHVAAVTAQALARHDDPVREPVHAVPAQFSLDGGPAVLQAEGMYADSLKAHVNIVSVERGPLRNLEHVIERCMLRPSAFLIAPYAAAKAVLAQDETELGVIVLDMGAANTSLAVFRAGRLEYACVIPVGSGHITSDIAVGLGISLAEAEKLKTLSGSALPGIGDDMEELSVSLLGEEGPGAVQNVPRSLLSGIIRPRAEEILELVRDELEACPAARAVRRVVLTGGGSQLAGMREMAERVLERTARVGAPRQIAGMPAAMAAPAFAVVAGLLRAALDGDAQGFPLAREEGQTSHRATGTEGYFSRVREWLTQSF